LLDDGKSNNSCEKVEPGWQRHYVNILLDKNKSAPEMLEQIKGGNVYLAVNVNI
jgi:hypothetical protein